MRFLVTLLLFICLTGEASAHASLAYTEPRDGAVLPQAPKSVELHFNEAVTAGAVHLIDATGKLRSDAVVDAKGEAISIALPETLPEGTQIVSYRVISQDGHPVAGSLTFSIGAPTANKTPETADAKINALIWLTRIGLYFGLFAGIGGVFFLDWIARERAASTLMLSALIIGIVSSVASLGLQGLDVLGLPLAGMLAAAPWTIALGTSLGPSLLIAIVSLILGVVALRGSAGMSRGFSVIALAGVGLSLAVSGHAATAPPQALTRPTVFLHGVAVAFWLGALAPLAAIVRRSKPAALPIVNRFSRIAVPVIGFLALTGLVLAIVQLESFAALVQTKYGIILSTKLVLVAALLGLAALNRFRLTPALARDAAATKPLARSILFECALAFGILAVVAGWRFTTPPRSLVPDAPLAVHIHSDKAMFQVLVSPGNVGSDDFTLQLMNGDGTLLHAKEATLTLSLPERGIEAIERQGALGPDGYWHVGKVPLTVPGRWHMRIDALVTDFQEITLEDDLDIPTQ
ncbi:MAG TPA: CopD family protein [Bradyrhizobium sp.]|uniref:copper resistance CopC/CopD family protein n=1 Tax=Bradyrhizobium sp. TaxID=376 RepID=UPI002BCA78D3|nr:CopD family protein [Bradyrhizobium sp.]HLZ04849.1 CopD family protein [Bradyrhizobium sp.]